MQVILQRDVPNLGLVGEVVSVKAGYARNYLVPNGLALVADPKAVRQWEHAQRLTEHAKRMRFEAQARLGDERDRPDLPDARRRAG